jgi:hypothetical protein
MGMERDVDLEKLTSRRVIYGEDVQDRLAELGLEGIPYKKGIPFKTDYEIEIFIKIIEGCQNIKEVEKLLKKTKKVSTRVRTVSTHASLTSSLKRLEEMGFVDSKNTERPWSRNILAPTKKGIVCFPYFTYRVFNDKFKNALIKKYHELAGFHSHLLNDVVEEFPSLPYRILKRDLIIDDYEYYENLIFFLALELTGLNSEPFSSDDYEKCLQIERSQGWEFVEGEPYSRATYVEYLKSFKDYRRIMEPILKDIITNNREELIGAIDSIIKNRTKEVNEEIKILKNAKVMVKKGEITSTSQ